MIEKIISRPGGKQVDQSQLITAAPAKESASGIVSSMDSDAAKLSAVKAITHAKVWCVFWSHAPALARWVFWGLAAVIVAINKFGLG